MKILFASFLVAVVTVPAYSGTFTLQGVPLLRSKMLRGDYWGKETGYALRDLKISTPLAVSYGPPHWYALEAFPRLWKLSPDSVSELDWVEVSTRSWFLQRGSKVLGFVVRVPLGDWDMYEAQATKIFGDPDKPHLTVSRSRAPPSRQSSHPNDEADGIPSYFEAFPDQDNRPVGVRDIPGDLKRYIHFYRWSNAKTLFLFLKGTFEDSKLYWFDRPSGSLLQYEVLQVEEDPNVPLYMGLFDRKGLRQLKR